VSSCGCESTVLRIPSHATVRGRGWGSSMPASRSVVSVLLRGLGDFSLHPQGRPCGRPPAALRPGGDTGVTGGTGLTLHLGGTNPRRISRTTSEAGGRRRASVALPPGRLNVLLRAIPAGRALVMEPALACPTTTPPKPRPHRLDPVQHARPPLRPTVLHARPNNKRSAKT
jgi:hypothetical protein